MADDPVRHEDHDLAALVAFVDGQADSDEAAAATAQLAACQDCVRLADDLRVVAAAERSLAVPARPRDFRLTPADAARLTAAAGEPSATPARLVSDMTDRHPTHDPALIAASVDDVLTLDERRTVDAWLTSCTACAELRADLLAIAAANKALPTPSRPRDYRLTEQDVARVGQARWKHLLAWIGGSRDGITRPLATGLMTLGLVGILISGVPALSFGAAGAATSGAPAAAPSAASGAENSKASDTAEPGADATVDPVGAAVAAPESTALAPLASDPDRITMAAPPGDRAGTQAEDGSTERMTTDQGSGAAPVRDAATPSVPVGLVLSLAALIAGALLFVVRRAARSVRSV